MTDKRKHMKIVIPASMVEQFDRAKADAEQQVMMKMSDTQYASRLVQWALEQRGVDTSAMI